MWGPNLHGKVVSAPEAEQESNFLKKTGRQFFFLGGGEKCTPDKILATPMSP